MNTQKKLTKGTSWFTMVVFFSQDTKYWEQHSKFTFRGDELTQIPEEQVQQLKLKRKELLESGHKLYQCTIYDNRVNTSLPFSIVKRWYHLALQTDNEHLLYIPGKEIEISPNFINRMINEKFLSHE